jgi:hypothetical protein
VLYDSQATVDAADAAISYQLVQSPTGMTINAATGLIAWTPTAGQAGATPVTIQATDAAGNVSQRPFTINVLASNSAPVLTAASPSLGNTGENTPITIALTGFINNGAGTTTVADSDQVEDAFVGIALVGVSGNGTWAYSLDGTTFVNVGTVSASSALLLPSTATLRYSPDNRNGESPTVSFRAWDKTGGVEGEHLDLAPWGALGGATPYSSQSDTATLTVLSVNDAPALTAAAPALGTVSGTTPTTLAIASFINNGVGRTVLTDVDNSAVLGGIALFGVTGAGTWEYSLDGEAFLSVGTLSPETALLLPADAFLRYTPDAGDSGGGATLVYRGWDATTGTSGTTANTTVNGNATAFSTATDTATLLINSAPVLTSASPSLGTTTENAATTVDLATFINQGAGTTTITDSNGNAVVGGIAVIAAAGHGTWAYSLDGTVFANLGTVSDSSVLLLPKTATLRYTPDNLNGETASITYRAWDTTSGANAARVDLSQPADLGGVTAYSVQSDTAALTVTSLNDAPVLTARTPSLGVVSTAVGSTAIRISSFVNNGSTTTAVVDVDSGAAVGGIALLGISGVGTWEYSLDGETFLSAGTPSAAAALLLPADSWLRLTPGAGTNSGSATIIYHAWDQTTGLSGGTASTAVVGGESAFSTATDTATLVINDAPILTPALPSLGSVTKDTPKMVDLAALINQGAGTTTISDPNGNATVGGIAVVAASGKGVWAYSFNGTTYTDFGAVSSSAALLLAANAKLRYTPNGLDDDTPALTYHAWDATTGIQAAKVDLSSVDAVGGSTAFSALSDTATLLVNNAPVLRPFAPALGTISEDVATTMALATFINHGTGTTAISDVNRNAVLGGIAVIGATGRGTWSYSLDGGATFIDIESIGLGAVSDFAALLLANDAQLRYIPDGENGETASVTYRAWDKTAGQSGTRASTLFNGGTTAFSTVADTASFTVAAVNDAPVLTAANPVLGAILSISEVTKDLASMINHGAGTTGIADSDAGAVLGGIAVIGTDGNGQWSYALDGATFVNLGTVAASSALLLPSTATLRYVPNAADSETATITYRAWDASSGTAATRIDLGQLGAVGGATAFSTATDTATVWVARLHDASTIGLQNPATSAFYLRNSNDTGYADVSFGYGLEGSGWVALAGDWNGDGIDTIGLYNPATSTFHLRDSNSTGNASVVFAYGPAGGGWTPIAGDWNGDGIDTIGLYDPATSAFLLRNSNSGGYANIVFTYGPAGGGWLPLAGDWNASGIDAVGLYNPATSVFYLKNTNESGYANVTCSYGPAGGGWLPVVGDWNADGAATLGLYNPAASVFYLRDSNDSGYAAVAFAYGPAGGGWKPLAGDWNGAAPALMAAAGLRSDSADQSGLSQADLQPIVREAIARWAAAGLEAAQLDKLAQVEFVVCDLAGSYLGRAESGRIYLDRDAAGHGWFVDPTPARDEEFLQPTEGRGLAALDARVVDRIDLLTVVAHELGHLAGFADRDIFSDDLMSALLAAGVRRTPG